ncbi:MAG: FimV/HubP family polar landmark protein [Arenicellales bacterium]|nr:FimV/HubP family polar landmark protein [Arenicellales bacterium]
MTTRHQRCFDLRRLLISLVAFFFVNQVHALGLGNLKVLSALDEPLVAEIELKSVTENELETLEVNLGSAEDFQRAGIDRDVFLGQLEFRIRKVGNPAIRINTTQPVKEPFLHFLIRAEWSDGKLIREYTALLDPPLYAAQQSIAVNTPGVAEQAEPGGASMAAAQQPEKESEPAPQLQEQTSVSEFSGAEYGMTERGDTLWGIASRLDTRGSDANIFQIMIALLRENPQAFVDNNINRLKVGQILRLSDFDSVTSISKEEASQTYQTQLAEWESYKMALAETSGVMKVPTPDTASTETPMPAAEPTVATAPAEPEAETMQATPEETTAQAPAVAAEPAEEGAPEVTETAPETAMTTPEVTETAPEAAESTAEAAPETPAAGSATAEQDLLKIVRATLEQEEGQVAGSPGAQAEIDAVKAAADKEIAALRDQIATIEEALVSSELQNKQMQERITLLEGQVENAQRLVELESQELALAQQQAAEAQAQATQAQQQAAQVQEQLTQAQQQAAQVEQQAAEQVAQAEQQASQQVAEAEQQALQAQQEAAQAAQQASLAQQAEQQTGQEAAATRPEQAVIEPITEQPVAQPVVQRSSKAWWESLLDTFVGSSMTIIAAVVGILVLLVALLLIMRRRRSIAEFEESILSGSALDGQTETTDTEATGTGTDTSFLSDFGMAGMGTMQADEVDPLAEAEVYLAYGRDEQAEEVLKEAAGRDPSRHELKLKLLEIYQQRNDLNSFETLAEELYPAGEQGDAETWNKVVEMGLKMNPNNPLFSQEVPSSVEESLTESISETLEQPKIESSNEETIAEAASDTLEEVLATAPASESLEEVPTEPEETPTELSSLEPMPASEDIAEVGAEEGEQPADTLDPALHPFPAPDQNVGLDEELDRLGKQMEETAVSMSAEVSEAEKSPDEKSPEDSENAEMLNFATTDPSELDFDIDLGEPVVDTQDAEAKATQAAQEDLPKEELIDFDLELSEESEMALKESQIGVEDNSVEQGALDRDFASLEDAQDQNLDETSFELEPTSLDSDSDIENAGDDAEQTEQWDEAATKLDLAQAYLNMGDKAGARSIIDEVLKEGSPDQKNQAAELAAQIN